MEREIKAFGNYYKEFYDSLDAGAQEKVLYGMLLLKTQERLSKKYVKFIRDELNDSSEISNSSTSVESEPEKTKHCPECNELVSDLDVVCFNCGYYGKEIHIEYFFALMKEI